VDLMKILIGAIFILSGSILLGLIHMGITFHSVGYTIDNFFYNLYYTKNVYPYVLANLQLVIGVILIILGIRSGRKSRADGEETEE